MSGAAPVPADLHLAVRASAARLALLVRRTQHPSAPALGSWDVTDVAIHAAHVLEGVTVLASGGGPLIEDIWDLPGFTATLVADEAERDLAAVADRIEAGTEALLDVLAAAGAELGPARPWLIRGIDFTPETMAGHVLNELVVHSWDLASAQSVPWPVPARHAALVLDTFVFPILGHLGRALVDQRTAAGVRASFDVRVRGGGRYRLRFDDGDLTVEPISGATTEPVDCHVSVDPAAFLLVAWGRRSQWPAIARGQLLAWGRRPWLGLKLKSLLRNP